MEPHFHLRRNPGSEESTDGEDHSKRIQCNVCVRKDGPSLDTRASTASQHQASGSGEHPYFFVALKNSSSASGHFPSCKLLNTRGSVLEPQLFGGFFP